MLHKMQISGYMALLDAATPTAYTTLTDAFVAEGSSCDGNRAALKPWDTVDLLQKQTANLCLYKWNQALVTNGRLPKSSGWGWGGGYGLGFRSQS